MKHEEAVMERLTAKKGGSSPDFVAENVERLRELFPEVFTEGKIDFEVLRETLGEYVDDRPERYSFTWNGKSQARRLAQTPSTATLRPCPEESLNWDTTQNLFIEGDNLEVLKLLQKSYHRKIKMIYIDPPYNTGGDFIYPDNYRDNMANYLRYTGQVDGDGFKLTANAETSGRYHTNWLNMMYPRLMLARNLLRDDGSMWISIDDHELHNLRNIMEELFGPDNFVATFIWEKRTTRENRRVFSFNHDYLLCFARDKDQFQSSRNLLPLGEEVFSRYSNPDNDPRGPWQSVSLNAQAGHATRSQFYSIETPGGRVVEPPSGRCWSVTKEKLKELIDDNRVWFGEDGNNVPRKKLFLSEARDGLTPHTLWTSNEVGTNDSAKKALIELFGGQETYDTPKPIELLKRIAHIASSSDDIILDFFAGSGSTGDAVMQLNNEDGGNRRFILVQLPEPTGATDYATVAEITKARLRAASNCIAAEAQQQLPDSNTERSATDLGFKVFKLDSSNIKAWDADYDDLEASLLDVMKNVKDGRGEDDVLYELLLKYGLDLGIEVERREVAGRKVYIIGAGALVVCLAADISLDVVQGIAALKAELQPLVMRVVFKDSGFRSDVVKTNAVQILKQAGIDDVKSL